MTNETKDKFETWGLLELFGHQRLAGLITEETVGGCSFIRIDVPSIDTLPAYTRFFGQNAIYGMTPTTEDVARSMAAGLRAEPIQIYDILATAQQRLEFTNARNAMDENDDGEEW